AEATPGAPEEHEARWTGEGRAIARHRGLLRHQDHAAAQCGAAAEVPGHPRARATPDPRQDRERGSGEGERAGRAGCRDAEEGRGGGVVRAMTDIFHSRRSRQMPRNRRLLLTGSVFVVVVLWASAEAVACPVCQGVGQPSKAQHLVTATDVVLAV